MRLAVRKHLRDFVALLAIFICALGVAGYILSNQRLYLPAWVPGVGTDFYKIEAEFETGQAIVPGQGQTVNIAGVKVGDIGKVELDDGMAVVELKIRRKYAPVYKDARILLRPKTGLKDMVAELNPGTPAAGKLEEGGRITIANTSPDVNPDQILAQLDGDTRAYLQVLLNAGGEAFRGGYPADLRETFKRFEPTARDVRAITSEVGLRRRNLSRAIHNFQLLVNALGDKDEELASLIDSSNANFEAFAQQDANIRQTLRELPPTLETTRDVLAKGETLASELGPALQALRPGARALAPALRATRPFVRRTTPIIRDQLRPFAREARPTVRALRPVARDLRVIGPRLTDSLKVINALFDTLAYNPPGPEEGYLFWASWVNHAGATIFGTQDAHGPIRRGVVIISCSSLELLEAATAEIPQLDVLTELLNAPRSSQVCPAPTPQGRRAPETDGEPPTEDAPQEDAAPSEEQAPAQESTQPEPLVEPRAIAPEGGVR
jgi:phospholipid/cholesterol/gamma-HCH transport system substrate-binding protein